MAEEEKGTEGIPETPTKVTPEAAPAPSTEKEKAEIEGELEHMLERIEQPISSCK